MFRYTINPDSDIPIYRQLSDQINAEIRSGALKTGTQLPTVREMAQQMGLSCGTVKRVYDRLQELGDIEMTRRRGTFVKYVRENGDSRKRMAMTAIDRMIQKLTELNFSPAEIQIFLNLKMREWGLKWSGIRIAMVTEYAEFAGSLEAELNRIGNVQVSVCDLRQVREYPYSVDEESDVILASPRDSQQLASILPDRSKLIKVALHARPESIRELATLVGYVGVACESDAFAGLVRDHLSAQNRLRTVCTAADAEGLDAVIVPAGWTPPAELDEALRDVPRVRFDYGIDEGSMISLEERVNRIRDERQLRPGAFTFQ